MIWKFIELYDTNIFNNNNSQYRMFQFKSDVNICFWANGFNTNTFKEFNKIK